MSRQDREIELQVDIQRAVRSSNERSSPHRLNLRQLVKLIKRRLRDMPKGPSAAGYRVDAWAAFWKRQDAAASSIMNELEGYGASYRHTTDNGGKDYFRLAGIATSCTSGKEGVLRNWCAAAERRIERGAA